MPLAQSRLAPESSISLTPWGCADGSAPSSELTGGASTSAASSLANDKSPETSYAPSSPRNVDVSVSRREIQSYSGTEGFTKTVVLPSQTPCSESCLQLPLCRDIPTTTEETFFQPFDSEELSSLPDPMCPDLTIQLGFDVRDVVQTLPDDSQAELLRYIVQFIRTRGLRCTYWFRDKSPEELCAALTRDESFSAAIRICADKTYSKQYADSLLQVICHVCRRPPAHRSRKSVRFAEFVQTIEAPASYPEDPPEPPFLAPFMADDLTRLHDPFSPDAITHLMLETAFCIQEQALADDPDTEVRVVRGIFDILLEKELVVPNLLTALDTEGLREVLQRDPALWETLGSLRGLLIRRDTGSFYREFTLIVRYLGRSLQRS